MVKKFKKYLNNKIKAIVNNANSPIRKELIELSKQNEDLLMQNGKILIALNNQKSISNIHETEFKIFSQWGDDGIIQYLINELNITNKTFVEFGVADYLESNTRFLLQNNNWKGLIFDGSEQNIYSIKNTDLYWKHNITAKTAFITAENINELIDSSGFKDEIGLLHIDIDGNDYWVWKAITVIDPIIAIIEFNSVFGKDRSITVPYRDDFQRGKAHYSNLYAGASLRALYALAQKKGYVFIGCNSAGNNAYFVKEANLGNLKALSLEEGYVNSKFREARNENGQLSLLNDGNRLNLIKGLEVYNTRTEKIEIL
jgi:hypothetical protein